jgi:uncharacterized membrane protein YgcG
VVATVPTFKPYSDIREYAVKMFENHGRGIGQRGKDNGLLILLAVNDRQVWVEVGYDLEQFVTDGFAGETSRQYMAPEFRRGAYGPGLLTGLSRIVARIARGRNVTLQGVPAEADRAPNVGSGGSVIFALFVLFIVLNAIARTRRRRRGGGWGMGGWSGSEQRSRTIRWGSGGVRRRGRREAAEALAVTQRQRRWRSRVVICAPGKPQIPNLLALALLIAGASISSDVPHVRRGKRASRRSGRRSKTSCSATI